jgi:hypothetical protein
MSTSHLHDIFPSETGEVEDRDEDGTGLATLNL